MKSSHTLATLMALASFASADPIYPACGLDTMANYIQNYTTLATACQVGDKLFYNFDYQPTVGGGAVAPTAAQVNIVGDPSNVNEPGLVFTSGGWTVSGTSTSFSNVLFIDAGISFTVAVMNLEPLIIDASLDMTNHFSVSGSGVADIGETIVFDGGTSSADLEVDSNAGPFLAVANFAPVGFVKVHKDLLVTIRSVARVR